MSDISRVCEEFAVEAAATAPDAPIRSTIWPTAGDMVDHLGTIQRWATAVVRTGASANTHDHERPVTREPIEWFRAGAAALLDALENAAPDDPCWTFVGPGRMAFWQRRMVHEATKHLWDLRTATIADPPMPPEVAPGRPMAIIDEFEEVFIARARRSGIAPLPASVLLKPTDSHRSWLIQEDWRVIRDAASPTAEAVLRASSADLALVLWERADPWRLTDRFARSGDEAALRALCTAKVHL